MKYTSEQYYSFTTVRKFRRLCRRACQPLAREMKARGAFFMKDEHNSNIIKSRRIKNRISVPYK